MTRANSNAQVTPQWVIEYVGRVVDPLEEHMTSHDTWHRDQLTAQEESRRALGQSKLAIYVAAFGVVTQVVLTIWLHKG